MLAIERRGEILERLQVEKRVVVSELSQSYGVSEETIRRDLEKLEKEGLIIKSYGGAVLNEQTIFDLPFTVRKTQKGAEKQQIAALVENLVRDNEAIMFDASSTAAYIARGLKKKKNLTVITNSVEILMEVSGAPAWTVISTGGTLHESPFALAGARTNEALSGYHVDKAVISCTGLSLDVGLTDSDEQVADSKRIMIRAAKERILVADHTKFGKVAFAGICGLDGIDKIVTDRKPQEEWLDGFERLGIRCIWPERNEN